MKIGVLGGTFDPPHHAHLELARAALEQLQLDEVIFVPAGRNPLKRRGEQSAPKHRLEMTRRMIAREEQMSVTDMEIERRGPSYTVDTMTDLQKIRPASYWFIMGADSLDTIADWHNPERLVKYCRLAVALRPPFDRSKALRNVSDWLRECVDFIDLPSMAVSSTHIRELVERGIDASRHLNPDVWQYVQEQNLYRNE